MVVTFPDGAQVHGTALVERQHDAPEPSFGLYLDRRWSPSWPFDLIDWPDFGLPLDGHRAASQIRAAYARAVGGEVVEVGCLGGLGRTGTVLACMAILGGVPPPEAVGWVRDNYDPRAIETPEQADWVLWFASEGRAATEGRPGAP